MIYKSCITHCPICIPLVPNSPADTFNFCIFHLLTVPLLSHFYKNNQSSDTTELVSVLKGHLPETTRTESDGRIPPDSVIWLVLVGFSWNWVDSVGVASGKGPSKRKVDTPRIESTTWRLFELVWSVLTAKTIFIRLKLGNHWVEKREKK